MTNKQTHINRLTVIRIEYLKLFRSKIFLITLAASLAMPIMAGLTMFILKDPQAAKNMGLLGQGGSIQGSADWPYYIRLLAKLLSFGLFTIAFGFVSAWVFGREYTERTAKDMLALPISRSSVVLAKLVAIATCCLVLFGVAYSLALLVGVGLHLEGWSTELALRGSVYLVLAGVSAVWLSTPLAFLASNTKGYLAPLGFIAVIMVLGNFVAALGYDQYYPWSLPLLIVTKGLTGSTIGITGVAIISLTGLAGLIGTLAWWRLADQY